MVILPSILRTSIFMVVFLMITQHRVSAYDEDLKQALLQGFQTLLQEKFNEFDYKLSQMNSTMGKLNTAIEAIANSKTVDVKSILGNIAEDLSVVGQVISLIESDKLTQLNVRMTEMNKSMVNIQKDLTLVGGTLNTIDSRRVEADNTILNTIIVNKESHDGPECDSGFIVGTQCFILYKDARRTWSAAVDKCQYEGYNLAEPDDSLVVPLRRYVLERYGATCVWLNARGNGTHMVWQQQGEGGSEVDSESSLWFPKYPGTKAVPWVYPGKNFTTNYCLRMAAWQPLWEFSTEQPYVSYECSMPHLWTLCQKKLYRENCPPQGCEQK